MKHYPRRPRTEAKISVPGPEYEWLYDWRPRLWAAAGALFGAVSMLAGLWLAAQ